MGGKGGPLFHISFLRDIVLNNSKMLSGHENAASAVCGEVSFSLDGAIVLAHYRKGDCIS